MHKPKNQHGVTLIELLVAMLLLAFGALGVASTQLASLRSSQESLARSQANILATEIIERMRGNYAHATNIANTDYHTLKSNPSTAMSGITNCDSSACSTSQLAAYDVFRWKQHLESQLPNGKGNINSATVSGVRTYTVIVYYTTMESTSGNERHTVVETVL